MTAHDNSMTARILPYFWYPALFALAVAVFFWLLAQNVALPIATYAPIVLVGFIIFCLEWRYTERTDWRPTLADMRSDATFMVLIQIVLPKVLLFLCTLTFAQWMHAHAPSRWWPQTWPLAAQAILMVIIVDLLRYWLHRACHTFPTLWELHKVHHSPDILYTLNVGRFHPLEKTLHFTLDTVPFLLLGVAPEVIAAYFLLYSVNGFFQHSNLRLRYGWLNYVVGSAETHRWHHAKDPRTAYCNFGNTTIIWDLVFGTWYLPRAAKVATIGIPDLNYPTTFRAQMAAPFRNYGRALRNLFADAWLRFGFFIIGIRYARNIAKHARTPMRTQHALLARIVADNRASTYGRAHNFAEAMDYAAFAQRVPVNEYETLRPYIETEIAHGEPALTSTAPTCYVRTSGTTGSPKDIPLIATHVTALRRLHHLSVYYQYRFCPAAFHGSILALHSPRDEGRLANDKPFGSASGVVAEHTPAAVRGKFVVPEDVLAIADSHIKYLLILRLALARSDLTYICTANPGTLLTLMSTFNEHATALLDDLRNGGFFLRDRVPDIAWNAVRKQLMPAPERAAAIARMRQSGTPLRLADLWPQLRMVVTWTCASARIGAELLAKELPPATRIFELGYLSSEFRGTVTLTGDTRGGLPTLDTHFFEFAERDAWDRGERAYLLLDQLQRNAEYYVIVTTLSGLYRYFINDIVRVSGFFEHTPLLEFVQKGKGVTSIIGEKLYEAQALAAVTTAATALGCPLKFLLLVADETSFSYRLYAEAANADKPTANALALAVDAELARLNIEYQSKRESRRLAPLNAVWLAPGTADAYKRHYVERGQREGQFKMVALSYRRHLTFDLDAHVER